MIKENSRKKMGKIEEELDIINLSSCFVVIESTSG